MLGVQGGTVQHVIGVTDGFWSENQTENNTTHENRSI
jgi:hypothetical protein